MNVGIIVYSGTGNTLSVAQKLQRALSAAGHTAALERVETVGSDPRASGPVALKKAPDIAPYDAVIFASPVHAFSLAPAMKLYLGQLSDLSGKKVFCFVTQHFKKRWLGGNRAVRQIQAACRLKNGELSGNGVVNWSSAGRQEQIEDIVTRLSAL